MCLDLGLLPAVLDAICCQAEVPAVQGVHWGDASESSRRCGAAEAPTHPQTACLFHLLAHQIAGDQVLLLNACSQPGDAMHTILHTLVQQLDFCVTKLRCAEHPPLDEPTPCGAAAVEAGAVAEGASAPADAEAQDAWPLPLEDAWRLMGALAARGAQPGDDECAAGGAGSVFQVDAIADVSAPALAQADGMRLSSVSAHAADRGEGGVDACRLTLRAIFKVRHPEVAACSRCRAVHGHCMKRE
jgi:hypothetical protein